VRIPFHKVSTSIELNIVDSETLCEEESAFDLRCPSCGSSISFKSLSPGNFKIMCSGCGNIESLLE
jgi:ribosomal protein S27E